MVFIYSQVTEDLVARLQDVKLIAITSTGYDLVDVQHFALSGSIFAGAGFDMFEGEEPVKEENRMLTRNIPTEKLQAVLQKKTSCSQWKMSSSRLICRLTESERSIISS